MPNDEDTKKRWRVLEWGNGTNGIAPVGAVGLETVLNRLDEEGYDIYDVDMSRCWVTGRLKPDEVEDGFSLPISIGQLLQREGTEKIVESLRQPSPPTESDAVREMREYQIQGIHTPQFMGNLRVVMYAASMGDPYVEQRLTQAIKESLFQISHAELVKTLSDVEFFREHHLKHNCDAPTCTSAKVYDSTIQKLKDRLAANPVS
jgi:hypothetical protein